MTFVEIPTRSDTIKFQKLLRLAAACLLFGRAWQHFFWNVNLSVFFADEQLMGWLPSLLETDWTTFIAGPWYSGTVQWLQWAMGLLLLAAGGVAVFAHKNNQTWLKLLPAASVWVGLLAALSWKAQAYQLPQFFEHASQILAPTLLYWAVTEKMEAKKLLLYTKLTVAITFTCHGLFALGFPYPQPGNFVSMTREILAVEELSARKMLFFWGLMDLLISIGIFIPVLMAPSLIYATLWGLFTALARITAYFDVDQPLLSLHQWLYQTIFRMPHALLPAAIWVMLGLNFPKIRKGKKKIVASS